MKFSSSKQLKFGMVLSYLSIGINILAGLLYTPWMIEQIGKDDYGLYTLANSLITLFLLDFGLASATGRYISKYIAEGRQDKVNNFVGVIYKLYLIIDAVIFTVLLVLYFFIDKIYVNLTPDELQEFKIVYIMAAAFAVVNFPFVTFNGILNSYEKFVQLKFADVIYRILVVALTVIALLMGQGLYAVVAVNAVVGLVVIIYKLIVIKSTIPLKVNLRYSDKMLYKEIFGFSVWATLGALAGRLVFNITPSILGIVASSTAIAVFGIVSVIEGYTYTITTAINGMFMPKVARIYEGGNGQKNLIPLMITVGRFQFALNGFIFAGFAAVGKSFIVTWMDNSYIDAYYGILLIVFPSMFSNSLQIANTALVVENKVKYQTVIAIVTGVTNVLLSFVLSYYFGVIGACVSIFIAYIVRVIVYFIVCQRVMKFDMMEFTVKCYIRMCPPIFISLIFGLVINWLIDDIGWITIILKGATVTAVYLISTFFTAINRNERNKIFKYITNK